MQLYEKLFNTKVVALIILFVLVASFFIANMLLAFLQELVTAIQLFADDPNKVTFSFDWQSMFQFQSNMSAYYIGFYILTGIGILKLIYNVQMNYKTLNKGQHGTSEFVQVKELKKQYKIVPAKEKEYNGDGGIVISGLQEKHKPYRLLIDDSPVHNLVIGITRSGKGETFVFPTLDVLTRAKNKPSLVINDPKGELAGASYETFKKRGYSVYIYNLIQQWMGMGSNPLYLVVNAWKEGNKSLAQQYANSVSHSLYHEPNAKDPFWSNSAKSLVNAIILALTEDAIATGKEETVNMYSVANFLATLGSEEDEEGNNALDQFFQSRGENNPARMMYATSNFAAGNTRASIFSVAMDKLQIFTLEPNAKMTSYNSVDLTEVGFGDKPVAIFMVTPDFDSSNHVLASIFVSQLYRVNAEGATMSPGGKMKRQVHFMLDEFGNMPPIEGMASMLTVGAGRGFRYHLIVQSYSQLKAKYGDTDSDTIIGNCSNQIYILTQDKETSEQFSALLGTKTITDVSRSGKLLSADKSHSESVKERPLLMPDELRKFKEGQSVVIRVNKRQDKKRRKITPKPIFNTGVTSLKPRWDYLCDDFDNSKSVLTLPIMSKTYHNTKLENIVFTSKTKDDAHVFMKDAMGANNFAQLKTDLIKIAFASDKEFGYLEEMDNWSFVHLLSYLIFELEVKPFIIEKIKERIAHYVSEEFLEEWKGRKRDTPKGELQISPTDEDDGDEREKYKEYALHGGVDN
ncbi:type IV secretion system protein VirD4 [Virgibacillus dokdonensis]|uniref:Type IV secretion system protein VirD4 n=1 Tax=Virgibacillus dokdonensis TaxID=302167 RepID=A0A3E0WPH0_9BACI|nr:type IV secretory system conjugative DNA transfer family protein [Virgibacillus dokdonensis]RFA33845.1 type IV secretion system protein VirD4 [Virgibacillus dokdonensis]